MPESLISKILQNYAGHYRAWLLVVILAAAVFYTAGIGSNPPGFYIDESSIAYNAHHVAQNGKDEHGIFFPLYFRSFGEYKNPAYIYLLAVLDRIFGPSILLARGLSVALGFAAALLIGILAARLSRSHSTGIFIGGLALFAPWLFEVSRLVYEVALFPLALVILLFWLNKATERARWSFPDSIRIVFALGLLTYTYSIGRLLAPLLAFGFVFFISRKNYLGILRTWALYALTLLPILFFSLCNPRALAARFYSISYVRPDSSVVQIVPEFVRHYINIWNPYNMLLIGDATLRQHVPGMGSILVAGFLLFALGIFIILREHHRNAWWRYILYGVIVSPIPASLTNEEFHTLRLIALPVFMLLVSVPALSWLKNAAENEKDKHLKRYILIVLITLAFLQTAWFQFLFHIEGRRREYDFEARYTQVLDAALQTGEKKIFLRDLDYYPSYIHAYWYSTVRGKDASQFIHLPPSALPPSNALVIGTAYACLDCPIVLWRDNFVAYYFIEHEK